MAKEIQEKMGLMYGYGIVINMKVQNVYTYVTGLQSIKSSMGSFGGGSTLAYTAVEDAGEGNIRVTSTGHGLSAGQHIALVDGVYDGVYIVQNIFSADKFDVTAVYSATDNGEVAVASVFTVGVGKAGEYKIDASISVSDGAPAKKYEFAFFRNGVELLGNCSDVTIPVGVTVSTPVVGGTDLADGDKIMLAVKCVSSSPSALTTGCISVRISK